MEVYRYLHENELNNILSGYVGNLGVEYGREIPGFNTHKYKSGINYMHFFKNKSSMLMTSYLYKNLEGNFYFCTFDIPFTVLALHGGKGYYPASGYEGDMVLKEYAIDAKSFNPNWLKKYELDANRKNITYSDVSHLSK